MAAIVTDNKLSSFRATITSVDETLFKRNHLGDWDAICLFLLCQLLHSYVVGPSATLRVCAYSSHSPTTAQALVPVLTVTTDHVITAGGKSGNAVSCSVALIRHNARSVEHWTFCQNCYGFNFTDGRTDGRHAVPILHFALKCIAW